jgi:hypothetical protein
MRTLAFGDLTSGVWGAALVAGDDAAPFVCVGAHTAVAVPGARLTGAGTEDEWRIAGEGVQLTLSPMAEAVAIDGETAGFEQLCRAQGRFAVDGSDHEVKCLARRGERDGDLGGIDSVRDVSALFEPADGFALVAFRPRPARDHGHDAVSAVVLDAQATAVVADPRFSTTYGGDGRPIRSSLELWLGEAENEYPRRAAGAAVGPHTSGVRGGLDVQAALFRWSSRGREGAGTYVLARPA